MRNNIQCLGYAAATIMRKYVMLLQQPSPKIKGSVVLD